MPVSPASRCIIARFSWWSVCVLRGLFVSLTSPSPLSFQEIFSCVALAIPSLSLSTFPVVLFHPHLPFPFVCAFLRVVSFTVVCSTFLCSFGFFPNLSFTRSSASPLRHRARAPSFSTHPLSMPPVLTLPGYGLTFTVVRCTFLCFFIIFLNLCFTRFCASPSPHRVRAPSFSTHSLSMPPVVGPGVHRRAILK